METNRKEIKEMHPHKSADGMAKDPTVWVDSWVENFFTNYKEDKKSLDKYFKIC